MSVFILLAAVMALAAAAVLAWPLLRNPGAQPHEPGAPGADPGQAPPRAPRTALASFLILPALAGALYTTLSIYDWEAGPEDAAAAGGMPAIEEMVRGLEARLASDGGSVEDWAMLGRSRFVMGDFSGAAEAYRQAYRSGGGNDADMLTAYAEALAMTDQGAMRSDAGDLFERALTLNPDHPKGLFYGGFVAFQREQFAQAKERWQRLMDISPPPEEVRSLLLERIAQADAQLGLAPATPPVEAPPDAGGAVQVSIRLASDLAADLNPATPLFVIARAPGAGGPPYAVVRLSAGELPLTVELSDRNAMMAGRTLSSLAEVELVARVALSGQPTASSGDLFGTTQYAQASGGGVAEILIDRVQP